MSIFYLRSSFILNNNNNNNNSLNNSNNKNNYNFKSLLTKPFGTIFAKADKAWLSYFMNTQILETDQINYVNKLPKLQIFETSNPNSFFS